MADKLLNPFADESKYSTEDLENFTDKVSPLFDDGWNLGMQRDTALHYRSLASDELKRRRELLERPDKAERINDKYDKRTSNILEGNEYRKRNNLSSGESLLGDSYYDHDIAIKGLRKANEATVNWLRKLIGKEPISRDVSNDPYKGEALASQAKRKEYEEFNNSQNLFKIDLPPKETTAEFLERIIKTRR